MLLTRNLRILAILVIFSASSSAKDLANTIDEYIQSFHNLDQFNGSVLVAKEGKVLFEKGYGMANFEWDIANTPITKFRIGSITKQFTSMLIMQLVQEGKVKLDAPIVTYIKDYREDIGKKVTVHQLLNHTSGIPSYTGLPGFFKDVSRKYYSVDQFTKEFCSNDLEFEPGTNYRYNNSGYFLLGNIIEKVTGKSYQTVLQEKIFTPLGMKNSGYDLAKTIIKNRASGYQRSLDGIENAPFLDMALPYAGGSLYSTVRDLNVWDSALYTDKLLSLKLIDKMYQPSEHEQYGYGWEIGELSEEDFGVKLSVLRHSGGINGFHSLITRIVEDKYVVIFLDNTGRGQLGSMTSGITKILYGKPFDAHIAKEGIMPILYSVLKNDGIKATISRFISLKEKRDDINEYTLNNFGYTLLEMGRSEDALAIFELNTKSFPKSANAFDSLAETQLAQGNKEQALANYKRSLALDPANSNAKNVIEKIQKEK